MTFYFYGNYTADIKGIFDILVTAGCAVTHNMVGKTGKEEADKPDFVVVSGKLLTIPGSKQIHTQHGLGFFPQIPVVARPDFLKTMAKLHKIVVHGEPQVKAFLEAGISNDKLMLLGMPASIQLLADTQLDERRDFLEANGMAATRQTVLYAPTWDHKEQRGLFVNWWQDGREARRVEELCRFIVNELECNFIIRLHQKHRYSQDWLAVYKDILAKYGVLACYADDDVVGFPYFKYADVLISDLSSVIVYFYVMDKPVIHIGENPFTKKRSRGWYGGTMGLADRCGYIVKDFEDLAGRISDSLLDPMRFSEDRQRVIKKHVKYTGDACREAIVREFGQLR